jgi:hypothetical protein
MGSKVNTEERIERGSSMRKWLFYLEMVLAVTVIFGALESTYAAEFFCPSGNVTCLIAAINVANQNGQENTINLEVGTYTLRAVDNNIVGPEGLLEGPSGLPSITGRITIRQNELGATIERDPAAQPFRLFHVSSGGSLNLFGLGLRYGRDSSDFGGGAIFNRGELRVERSAIYQNTKTTGPGFHTVGGAGISNRGHALILHSEISGNVVTEDEFVNGLGGGILNIGEMEISDSFIFRNRSVRFGGGILNTEGSLRVTTTAIYDNLAEDSEGFGGGGGIEIQTGSVIISNSTIARNQPGGISSASDLTVVNATIAGNRSGFDLAAGMSLANVQNSIIGQCVTPGDFGSSFNSLGHNIIHDDASCAGHFEPTDLVTDPLLAEWNSDGAYFHLLPDSPAINSADPAACSATDQLGNPRLGICDRGSVEFQGARLVVAVDIRPRKDANRINPSSNKSINVAIFSGDGFDATSLNLNTVRFGATGTEAAPIYARLTDIDEDGRQDLVLRFQILDTGIKCGDTSAALTGQISTGQSVVGSSPLTTVQCKQRAPTFASR